MRGGVYDYAGVWVGGLGTLHGRSRPPPTVLPESTWILVTPPPSFTPRSHRSDLGHLTPTDTPFSHSALSLSLVLSRTQIGTPDWMFICLGVVLLEDFSFTFHEWISSGIGLPDAETLVLYGSTFLLSWDRVVVKLWSGGICCGGYSVGWWLVPRWIDD